MMSPSTTAPSHRNVAALVGRCAALCAHPYAVWRVRPRSARVLLVSAYATAAYIVVLAALLVL
jgi:hypothetical protein